MKCKIEYYFQYFNFSAKDLVYSNWRKAALRNPGVGGHKIFRCWLILLFPKRTAEESERQADL